MRKNKNKNKKNDLTRVAVPKLKFISLTANSELIKKSHLTLFYLLHWTNAGSGAGRPSPGLGSPLPVCFDQITSLGENQKRYQTHCAVKRKNYGNVYKCFRNWRAHITMLLLLLLFLSWLNHKVKSELAISCESCWIFQKGSIGWLDAGICELERFTLIPDKI